MSPSSLARTLIFFGFLITPGFAQEAASPRFLVNGYPLGDTRTHLDDSETRAYRRALAAFPGAASCLQNGNDVTTSALDLEAFSNLAELEVCLFLTADVLRDLEGMRALLQRSGFDYLDDDPHPYSIQQMKSYGVEGVGLALNGLIASPSLPNLGFGMTRFVFGDKSVSIFILLDPNHLPVDVSVNLDVL